MASKHRTTRGSWLDQKPARDNTLYDPVKSAKPRSPVQIRAAPPIFQFKFDGLCSSGTSRRSQLDYGGLQIVDGPRGRIPQITVCEALRCSRVGRGRRFPGPPPLKGFAGERPRCPNGTAKHTAAFTSIGFRASSGVRPLRGAIHPLKIAFCGVASMHKRSTRPVRSA